MQTPLVDLGKSLNCADLNPFVLTASNLNTFVSQTGRYKENTRKQHCLEHTMHALARKSWVQLTLSSGKRSLHNKGEWGSPLQFLKTQTVGMVLNTQIDRASLAGLGFGYMTHQSGGTFNSNGKNTALATPPYEDIYL
jgi:hypothetical protein